MLIPLFSRRASDRVCATAGPGLIVCGSLARRAAQGRQGYVLLELVLAMLITTLLAVWAAGSLADRIHESAAHSAAEWMGSLRQSAERYVGRYYTQLALAQDPGSLLLPGYALWERPAIAELKAEGLLSAGFPETNGLLGGATIQVLRNGSCPGDLCQIEALIYSDRPLAEKPSGRQSEQMVAQWLWAARGKGGYVRLHNPESIGGAAFRFPNPPVVAGPVLPPGTVAMAVTSNDLSNSAFLRQFDQRDPSFQGSATIEGVLRTNSSLEAAGYLQLGATAGLHDWCTAPGAIAHEEGGGLLVCRAGRWRSSGSGGGGYAVSSVQGCMPASRNPVTGNCSCAPLSVPVLVSDNGSNAPDVGRMRGYLCVG